MKRVALVFPVVLILFFFMRFTSIPLWDPDFFWHLKTGEYIAHHGEIPEEDSFSYTTPAGETLRKKFILGQYWLSQVIFYYIYQKAGVKGIVVFRALLLSLTLAASYFLLRKKADPLMLSMFLLISGSIFMYFTGERPQLFSFLGIAALIFVIERYRESRGRVIYILPAMMLIWANLHGGVMLGNALLLVYMLSESAKFLFKLNPLGKNEYLRFIVFCTSAFAVTAVNPNTYHLFIAFYQFTESISLKTSIEFLSPLTIALRYKKIYWEYFFIIFLVALIILLYRKKIDFSHMAVIAFLSVISLKSARYMIFPAIVFPLFAANVSHLFRDRFQRIKIIAAAGMIIFMCYVLWEEEVFAFRIQETYPSKAVEFIKKTRPSGNIFNYYDWGGYLIAMLPEYKVFIDGRGLDENILAQYNMVLYGSGVKHGNIEEWELILDKYSVNIVLLPLYDSNTGEGIPLVRILMDNKKWRLSYVDERVVIFSRLSQ